MKEKLERQGENHKIRPTQALYSIVSTFLILGFFRLCELRRRERRVEAVTWSGAECKSGGSEVRGKVRYV